MAYEMGKSFARHKDDADLENHLKDADNENDPMMKVRWICFVISDEDTRDRLP